VSCAGIPQCQSGYFSDIHVTFPSNFPGQHRLPDADRCTGELLCTREFGEVSAKLMKSNSIKESKMKTIYLVSGSLAALATFALQPCMAQEASNDAQQPSGTQTVSMSSEAPVAAVGSQSSMTGKTREDVQRELSQFRGSAQEAHLQDLYKGN
jgi:hypothetical protein